MFGFDGAAPRPPGSPDPPTLGLIPFLLVFVPFVVIFFMALIHKLRGRNAKTQL